MRNHASDDNGKKRLLLNTYNGENVFRITTQEFFEYMQIATREAS